MKKSSNDTSLLPTLQSAVSIHNTRPASTRAHSSVFECRKAMVDAERHLESDRSTADIRPLSAYPSPQKHETKTSVGQYSLNLGRALVPVFSTRIVPSLTARTKCSRNHPNAVDGDRSADVPIDHGPPHHASVRLGKRLEWRCSKSRHDQRQDHNHQPGCSPRCER